MTAAEIFDRLTGELDYPMLIVTTATPNDGRAGCLVGFSTQSSIDPHRYLVCLSDKNRTTRVAREAEALAVHFVPASAADLAELFGSQTGDEVDKFAQCDWHPGPGGLPILDRCGRWFAGRILERWPLGDHIGYLLEPFAAADDAGEGQFSFHRAKRMEPGHEA